MCAECGNSFKDQLTVPVCELHTFKVMPKRRVVERSFAWLEKNQRLWKNCERDLSTRLQLICRAWLPWPYFLRDLKRLFKP